MADPCSTGRRAPAGPRKKSPCSVVTAEGTRGQLAALWMIVATDSVAFFRVTDCRWRKRMVETVI